MLRNREVAALLDGLAELPEAAGDSPFRIGAYRTAARRVAGPPQDVAAVWRASRLKEIPGVGASIAVKIDELLRTGRLRYREELRRRVAPGLTTLLLVPGLGPRRARNVARALGVDGVAALARAAREHRLRGLPGFGERLEASVLGEALGLAQRTRRWPLGVGGGAGRVGLADRGGGRGTAHRP
jgi:DNA polymerase (family 10)